MRRAILAVITLALLDAPVLASESEMPQVHPHAAPKHDETAVTHPLKIEAAYSADIWHVASGGVESGSRYLDNFDLIAEADLEELVGWRGATAFAYMLYNNGNSLSALLGDAQVASNIETGVKAVRLYEAWIDQRLTESVSLRIGLYDLNSEFDALETSGLFLGSAHGIGTDISQSGENGPSIFPVTSLAARLSAELTDKWSVRAAILDAVPGDPARPGKTAITLDGDDGALLIGEIERSLGKGRLIAGYWRYTAEFDRLAGGASRGNDGVYLRGEMPLIHEDDKAQGLKGFFRMGLADGKINRFDRFASVGLTYTGLLPGRDGDQIGLAAATAILSPSARQATGSKNAETALELTYQLPVGQVLTLQPNVQYIINPDANGSLSDALALGLRIIIGWSN